MNDEGLAQVFDSNTDFVSDSSSRAREHDATCGIHAAFAPPDTRAELAKSERTMFDDSNFVSCVNAEKPLIPYDKSSIQVLKEKKKKSRPFCRFEKRRKPLVVVEVDNKIENDDNDDNASDISNVTTTSLQSISGDCASSLMNNSWASLRNADDLPDVHGGQKRNPQLEAQVQMRKLNRRLDILRAENEQYASMAREIPDFKQEVFDLKSSNFSLQRENANLKSQLEAALKESKESLSARVSESDATISFAHFNDNQQQLEELKQQLWQVQDDNLQLRSNLTKLRLDLKSRHDEVKRLETNHDTLDNANLELLSSNQKLMQKVRELEANLQSVQRSKLALEQNLNVLQSERESFVKSRDWYRDQMHTAQDSRSSIQHELILSQSEIATKSNQLEKLKIEFLQLNKTLDEEREKALQEKDDMKKHLEDLEVSLIQSNAVAKSLDLDIEELHRENQDQVEPEEEEDKDDNKVQLEVLKCDIKKLEEKNLDLVCDLEELQRAKQDLMLRLNDSVAGKKQAEDALREIQASKAILLDDVEAKKEIISQLEGAKINYEMDLTKLKLSYGEVKKALDAETESSQELKSQLRKEKETLEHRQSQLELVDLELKHLRAELSKARTKAELQAQLEKNVAHLEEQMANVDKERQIMLDESKDKIGKLSKALEMAEEESKAVSDEKSALEARLDLSLSKIDALQATIKVQAEDLEKLKCSADQQSEHESNGDEDDSEYKVIQGQKIQRLENSLKVYESEIHRLTSKIHMLEDQVLVLEHKNGRLIMDSNRNISLKSKIQKLQEEIAKDTALRKELLSSLELAKSSLTGDIDSLEKKLHAEKENHCETKNRLLLLEHECSALRVDRRSLRTGLEMANLTIDKLKILQAEHNNLEAQDDQDQYEDGQIAKSELKEVKSAYEDAKRTITSLEDQLHEVRFQLKQKQTGEYSIYT